MSNYQKAIDACLRCVEACENCFDACLQEDDVKHMVSCIRLDRECADICAYTAQAMQRNSPFVRDIAKLCAEVCQACGDECQKHDHDHCQQCAEACYECAKVCREIAA
ncbi:four-helix bundle copper-binding protein [Halalkalibacillus halophilus]|uniref:four-helix bundle copper-binding protein n=1 Tax=Halalkalibacillus halophilus TaxID=392827 RepID=UPI00041BFFD2|nr:four-helix bundle copper-binding protein [Halalkalibacillus halophilus]